MDSTVTRIDRSNILILALQISGVCSAIRHACACNVPIGDASIETLKKLHDAFAAIHAGPSLKILPPIDSISPVSDILTFAEVLRNTVDAFLTPDEITEKRHAMGFHGG